MAKWRKRFEAWKTAKQPISTDEVESLLYRVFKDRVIEHEGTSHRWTVDVSELVDQHDDFKFGEIGFPVSKGTSVKAKYCQIAFDAAQLLGLPSEAQDDSEED